MIAGTNSIIVIAILHSLLAKAKDRNQISINQHLWVNIVASKPYSTSIIIYFWLPATNAILCNSCKKNGGTSQCNGGGNGGAKIGGALEPELVQNWCRSSHLSPYVTALPALPLVNQKSSRPAWIHLGKIQDILRWTLFDILCKL